MATKKISAKNSRAKRLENIEWLIKVTIRQKKNQEAFKKSYFGSEYINKTTTMAKTNFTPERQITPDFDDRFKPCIVCDGTGKVIVWDDDEGEQTPEYENCEACEGEGKVEIDDWENEW